MGITYNSFMNYRNDASLYASLNDDNKRKFWEYAETNKLAPLKLSESLAAEKDKYVRPGFVNPRYLETDLGTKAYGMDKSQIKATEAIMRKQISAYKPTEIATRKAEEAKRMSATNVANAPKMPGIMPGFLPKTPALKPFERTQPSVKAPSTTDTLGVSKYLPKDIKTIATEPKISPKQSTYAGLVAQTSGSREQAKTLGAMDKARKDEAKIKMNAIEDELKTLGRVKNKTSEQLDRIRSLGQEFVKIQAIAKPEGLGFLRGVGFGLGEKALKVSEQAGLPIGEAFQQAEQEKGFKGGEIAGNIVTQLGTYAAAGAVIRNVPVVAKAAEAFGTLGTNLISKLPGVSGLVAKVGAENTAKFIGQQGVDYLIDRVVQEPQAVFKAIKEDETLDEYAKGLLTRSAVDVLFNLAIGLGGEAVSKAIKDKAAASLSSRAGIEQMRQLGVEPDDVLKAIEGDAQAIDSVRLALTRTTGIDTPITRQLGQEPLPQLARQAEQADINKTTTGAIEAFQNWRKENFGGAAGTVSPGDLKALQELYLESTGIDIRKLIESGAERQRLSDVALGGKDPEGMLKELGDRVRSGEIPKVEAEQVADAIVAEAKSGSVVSTINDLLARSKQANTPKVEAPRAVETPSVKPIEPSVGPRVEGSPNVAAIKTPEVGESLSSVKETIKQSGVLDDTLRSKLNTADKLATTTDDARRTLAQQAVKDDFEGTVALLRDGDQFSSRIEPFMAKDTISKLQESGRYDDALDIIEAMAKKRRASGQDVQSGSDFTLMSPEGMGRWATKTMESAGLTVDREVVKSVMSKVKELQSASLESMAKEIAGKTGFNLQFFSKNILTKENMAMFKNPKKTVQDIAKVLTEKTTKAGITVPKSAINEMAAKLKSSSNLGEKELTELIEVTLKEQGVNTKTLNRVMGRYNFEEMKALNTAIIMKEVTDKLPISLGRKVSTFQAISHLLNGRTFMRNIEGNVASILAENISKIPASMADRAMSLYTNNRSVIAAMPKFKQAYNEGIKAGAKSIDEILLGVNRVSNDKYDLFFGNTFKSKTGKFLEKSLSMSLVAPDELFKGFVRADGLYNQVRARMGDQVKDWDFKKILDNATMDEVKVAADEARFATFQNDSFASGMLTKIKETLNRIPVIPYKGMKPIGQVQDFGVGDLVLKYTKVPGNIITRGIEYSPIGYLKVIHGLGRMGAAKGKIPPSMQRQIAMQFGRATTGSGLFAVGGWLHNMGVITSADKSSDYDAQALSKAEGLGNYKLNMSALERMISGKDPAKQAGDTIVSYDWLQPLGTPLAVGAKVTALNEDKKFGLTDLSALGQSSFEEAMDIPSLFTIKSMFYEAQGEGNAFDILSVPFKDAIPGFIPSPIRQTAQFIDPTVREAKTLSDKVKANIPGLSKTLLPKVDPTGKEIKRDQNAFDAFLNPAAKTTLKPIVYADNLRNIAKLSGKDSIFPDRKAPTSITDKKVKLILTPEEKVAWMKTEGSEVDRLYTKNLKFKDADTEKEAIKLAKLLEALKAKASEKAKKELLKSRK